MSSSDVARRGMGAAWAVIDALVSSGCTRFIVAPGSRSAPLALAVARHPGAQVDVVLDERSAAFYALGIAKASARPAAVITTSGTATANLLPAIVEASQSCVPIIALTADRPPSLRGSGANQTIAQPGLYGGYVRHEADLLPAGDDATEWSAQAREAVSAAMGRPSGPVHLNLCFEEPLIAFESQAWPVTVERRIEPREVPADVERLSAALARGARGVILAGTLERSAPSVAALADALGWPLIAEPTSGMRVDPGLSAGISMLGCADFIAAHAPEVVLQIGGAPTSRPALNMSVAVPELLVLHESGRPADPGRRATATASGDVEQACIALAASARESDPTWLSAWRRADAAARIALDAALDSEGAPTELRLARDVAAVTAFPLFVGSSLPVRDLDTAMAPRELRVFGNRGASGIDGTCATTYGIASVFGGATGLIGDLAIVHDAGSILWGAATSGATLVIPDNRGGGIFDLLPSAALPEHEALFRTPHQVRFADLASAAGASHVRLESADEIADALRARPALIEVPIDPDRSMRMRATVAAAVKEALAAL